ncbi:MAG: PQQ-dependent sugar dehydrogenase, partial [Chloroflexota bacterium]
MVVQRWLTAELLLMLGLLLLALLARVPYLWNIPRFTDETAEAEIALRIARGHALPLTNRDPYIGALWNYLLAAAFAVGGPSLYLPRTLVAVFGALTLLPTYLLARGLQQRLGGTHTGHPVPVLSKATAVALLAGVFLALSPAHIAVNSHIAWSNCVTPLFSTLGIWLAHRAITQDRPGLLTASGLVLGLALQTHPVAVLVLPGVAAGVTLARPRWLRGRWPWLSVLLALIGSANLLIANLRGNFAGLTSALAVQAGYTGGEVLTVPVYLDRLRQTVWLLTDSLGGMLVETGPLAGPTAEPAGPALLAAGIVGFLMLARRRAPLLLLVSLCYVALLPLMNGRFESAVPKARYIAPLLPLLYAAAALAIVEAFRKAGQRLPSAVQGLRLVLAAGLLALVVFPLLGLTAYYQAAVQAGRTNAEFFRVVAAVEASRRPGDTVSIERAILRTYTLGGGQLAEHLEFAGAVYGWQRSTFDIPSSEDQTVPAIVGPMVVRGSILPQVRTSYLVEPVDGGLPGAGTLRVLYARGLQPHLLTADHQPDRDDVPQPPRPPRTEAFVAGLAYPSALQVAPDGRLFFAETLEGRVRIASSTGQLQPEPFVTLATPRSRPTPTGLGPGVLGLALALDFAQTHHVYLYYVEADTEGRPLRSRLVRYTEHDGRATEEQVILDDLPVGQVGAGGGQRIAFGPSGALYVVTGDAGADSRITGQPAILGTVLRATRAGTAPGAGAALPGSSPGPFEVYVQRPRSVTGLAFHPR